MLASPKGGLAERAGIIAKQIGSYDSNQQGNVEATLRDHELACANKKWDNIELLEWSDVLI